MAERDPGASFGTGSPTVPDRPPAAMVGDKLRFRFRKTGSLRLLSHLDLMRCFERMLRRADIPFKSTAGFHPTPRLVFAMSLPLGIVGRDEVVELELTEPRASQDVLAQLTAQAPDGLSFTSVVVVPMKASAVPRRAVYALSIPKHRESAAQHAVEELLARPKVWVNRYHPRPRQVNVRPYLRNITVRSEPQPDANASASPGDPPKTALLELDLWVTGTGTARADDVIRLLQLGDVLDAGAILERIHLEIRDESPATTVDMPPDGPPETLPLDHAAASATAADDTATEPAWGLSLGGPVVE